MAKKNNQWLVWLILLIAIVALVLAAIAIHKANVTGQGIFDWKTKASELPQYHKILWAHDGKNCNQECSQQLGNDWKCFDSLLSSVNKFDPVTREYLCGQDTTGMAVDFVYNDIPQQCTTVYEMRETAEDCGGRLMVCTCMNPNNF